MTITVTQHNSEAASHGVTIYVDREKVGVIGPGETLTIKRERVGLVRAECGVYSKSIIMDGDGSLMIRWNTTSKEMDLSPVHNM